MKLIQRVGYYLGGFSMGLILLAFFLSGKKTSCSYGPNARVLKDISKKRLVFTETASKALVSNQIDSLTIIGILGNGNVNFSESDTKLEYCKIYIIEDSVDEKEIALTLENCEQKAIVKSIKVN